MDETDLIERLGSVGDGPAMRHPADAALVAGRRARRRRTVAGFAASGTALATAAAVALVVANAGGAAQFVEAPSDPAAAAAASPPPITGEEYAKRYFAEEREQAEILQRHLGRDWEVAPDRRVSLRPGTPTERALPKGFTVYTEIQPAEFGELDQWCGSAVPAAGCERRTLRDGRQVWVQHGRQEPDPKEPNIGRLVHVIFEQADGDLVRTAVTAVEPAAGSTAAREKSVVGWLDALLPKLIAAVTDPDLLPTSHEERDVAAKAVSAYEEKQRVAHGQATDSRAKRAMLAELGPDWELDDSEQVVLVAGSPTARRLPRDYQAWTQVFASLKSEDGIAGVCSGIPYEKGRTTDPCIEWTLADGSTAYVQWSRWAPTPKDVQPNIGVGVRVMYVQPDGDEIWLDLNAGQAAGTASEDTQNAARAWLEDYVESLVEAAADPDV